MRKSNDTFSFVQIAIKMTEIFRFSLYAVIYTDQSSCHIVTWTKHLNLHIIKCHTVLGIDAKQIYLLSEQFDIHGLQSIPCADLDWASF